VIKSLTPVLVMFPLLGVVGTDAAIAVTNNPLGILKSPAPMIDQTEDGAVVKVAEGCGIGYFRDGAGRCRYYGYGAPAAPPGEACPPDRHFVPWVNHEGGRCVLNGY
jgi:hypothetical protein